MKSLEKSVPISADRTVSRLIVAAVAVMVFTLAAGALLHNKIDRLIAARDWSEHSLEVQGDLEAMLIRLDRYDALANLYLVNHVPGRLREVQNLGMVMESSAHRIATEVSDNPRQLDNSRQLIACAGALAQAARSLDSSQATMSGPTEITCREVTLLMQEQERGLSAARSKESQNSTMSLLVVGLALACFSIFVVVILFGVLLRDALFRRRAEGQLSASNAQLAATVEMLEEQATQAILLNDARDQLQMCNAADDAYNTLVHFVAVLLPGSSGALCMIDNSRRMIELQSGWGDDSNTLETFPLEACCSMRSGQVRWRTPTGSVLHCGHFKTIAPERYVCMPLVAHGDTLGVLYVECDGETAAQGVERHLEPLRALLQLASMTVAAINLRSRLENQSIRDSLTGLFNRHFMEITLEREIRRATRREVSMAVFMIDADNFKQFNDTFGHKAGDTILRAVAERFLASVRSEDIVCRYGGEEFVIILPDISPEKASERAEQVREAISSLRVTEYGQTLGPVTVSIGVAIFPQDGRTIESLLQASDRSLYAAKKYGRNQVVFAADAAHIPVTAK